MLKKQYLKDKPVCKVTFILSKEAAEGASDVRLLGDFNNWNIKEAIAMKAGKDDFKTVVELEAGRSYEFRYIADGVRWLNDWHADDYVASPFMGIDNSVVRLEAVTVKATAPKAKAAASAPKKAAVKKPAAKKAPAAAKKAVAEKKAPVAKKAVAEKKAPAVKKAPVAKKAVAEKKAPVAKKAPASKKTSGK